MQKGFNFYVKKLAYTAKWTANQPDIIYPAQLRERFRAFVAVSRLL